MVLPLIIAGLAIAAAETVSSRSKSKSDPGDSKVAVLSHSARQPKTDRKFETEAQGKPNAELQIHINPRYRNDLLDAFEVIQQCKGWQEFTTYPIVFTSDDSSDACSNPKHNRVPYAHTDGERINICSCCWELTPIDLAFVLLHEWHHIHCRQRGKKYGGDREERDCDMYALGVLHRGGLTTEEIVTRFVKPGD